MPCGASLQQIVASVTCQAEHFGAPGVWIFVGSDQEIVGITALIAGPDIR